MKSSTNRLDVSVSKRLVEMFFQGFLEDFKKGVHGLMELMSHDVH